MLEPTATNMILVFSLASVVAVGGCMLIGAVVDDRDADRNEAARIRRQARFEQCKDEGIDVEKCICIVAPRTGGCE